MILKERPNIASVKELGVRLENDSGDSRITMEHLRFNIAFAVTSTS